jgi:hypothetical protein
LCKASEPRKKSIPKTKKTPQTQQKMNGKEKTTIPQSRKKNPILNPENPKNAVQKKKKKKKNNQKHRIMRHYVLQRISSCFTSSISIFISDSAS